MSGGLARKPAGLCRRQALVPVESRGNLCACCTSKDLRTNLWNLTAPQRPPEYITRNVRIIYIMSNTLSEQHRNPLPVQGSTALSPPIVPQGQVLPLARIQSQHRISIDYAMRSSSSATAVPASRRSCMPQNRRGIVRLLHRHRSRGRHRRFMAAQFVERGLQSMRDAQREQALGRM